MSRRVMRMVPSRRSRRCSPSFRTTGACEQAARVGLGLVSLAERVALTGGTLAHGPDGGGDFVLTAAFPWEG
jgi:hypothetical protein